MSRDRACCDGLCEQGLGCPALRCTDLRLAPGVVDGPHKPAAGLLTRLLRRARRWLRDAKAGRT
jgi:hypothetical protein